MLHGFAHKYGKNVDTDVIIPGRYCNLTDMAELGKHALEDLDREFVGRVRAGDVVVADANFGCGSSREHAPIALKGAGVSAVIAKSFARIFYRNALNIGLPVFACADAVDATDAGDEVLVDPASGSIENVTKGLRWTARPLPPFMRALVEAGGLRPYVEQRLRERSRA